MSLLLANEDYELKAVDSAGASFALTDTTASIIVTKAEKVKLSGKFAIKQLSISILAGKTTAITNGDAKSVNPGVIQGTSVKIISQNSKLCLADDSVTSKADLQNSKCSWIDIDVSGSAGQTTCVTDVITVWIAKSGQEKVRCE